MLNLLSRYSDTMNDDTVAFIDLYIGKLINWYIGGG